MQLFSTSQFSLILSRESSVLLHLLLSYLGITLDHKLLWTTQWENQIQRAKTYLFTIIPYVTKKWGPKPTYIKWVYTAIVRSRILYGFYTWGHSIGTGKRLEQLQRINKLACKMIAPCRHTTPRKALEVIYDLIPLELLGIYEGIATLTRMEENLTQTWIGKHPTHTTYRGHRNYWKETRDNLMGRVIYTDRIKETSDTNNFRVDEQSLTAKRHPTPAQISSDESDKH